MENREASLEQIWQAVRNGKKFFIAGHLNPDGDSLGSTLTMTSLLERLGKEVYAYCAPAIGNDLKFLPGLNKIHVGVLPDQPDFDTVILLECSDRKRGGDLESVLSQAKTLINIDHHLVSDDYGDLNHIDSVASSTAEIIFQFLKPPEKKIYFPPPTKPPVSIRAWLPTRGGLSTPTLRQKPCVWGLPWWPWGRM